MVERESARNLDQLFPIVYEELRRISHRALRGEHPGHTLGTTALVHEAYLRLAERSEATFEDRRHFLALAARAMRQVLIDHARRFRADKRGGGMAPLSLDENVLSLNERADVLVALDEALDRLGALEPRLARVVECRFFAGYSEEETGEVLGVTQRTVRRDWVKAKGWLYEELSP
jgi:RNA polymerase sigma factor (TIGR02999 family)